MALDAKSKLLMTNVHPSLVRLIERVNEVWPSEQYGGSEESGVRVICGHRTKAEQDKAIKAKTSKTPWPKSKHNSLPAMAVDLLPLPFVTKDWNNFRRWERLGCCVVSVAKELGINIRWGADWNRNGLTKDEQFRDYPHFELLVK